MHGKLAAGLRAAFDSKMTAMGGDDKVGQCQTQATALDALIMNVA